MKPTDVNRLQVRQDANPVHNVHPLQITPSWAAAVLEQHEAAMRAPGTTMTNRSISTRRVEKYAQEMQQGKFAPITMVVLDGSGQLLDGFHRLSACVKAGVPFGAFVLTGADSTTVLNTVDTGRRKTLQDVLRMDNWENPSTLSSALNTLAAWQHHDAQYVQHHSRTSTMDYRRLLDQTYSGGLLLAEVAQVFRDIRGKASNAMGGRGPAVAIAYYQARDLMLTDPTVDVRGAGEYAATMLAPMLAGDANYDPANPLPDTSPLLYVHRRLQGWASGGGSIGGVQRLKHSGSVPQWAYHQIMVDAVNAYLEGSAWSPTGSTRTDIRRGIPMLRGALGNPIDLEVASWL